jgi:hypothetical protein
MLQVNLDQELQDCDNGAAFKAPIKRVFGPSVDFCVVRPKSYKLWISFKSHESLVQAAGMEVRELQLPKDRRLVVKKLRIVPKSSVFRAPKPSAAQSTAVAQSQPPAADAKPSPATAQKASSFTITLKSAADAVIDKCAAPLVLKDIKKDLEGVPHAVEGLISTGESLGKTRSDFIFANFRCVQSAAAALQHYQQCKTLHLQGKEYAVTADWDKRCKELVVKSRPAPVPDFMTFEGNSPVYAAKQRAVCSVDISDLLGLGHEVLLIILFHKTF